MLKTELFILKVNGAKLNSQQCLIKQLKQFLVKLQAEAINTPL